MLFFFFFFQLAHKAPTYCAFSPFQFVSNRMTIEWSMWSSSATFHIVLRESALIALNQLLSTSDGWPLHSSSRLSFPLQNFFIITALPPYPKCVQKKAQNLRRNCQATNTYTSCLKPGPYLLHFHGENFHFLPPFPHSQLAILFPISFRK